MKPKMTIGISFFNPGVFFKIALQSIFAQTFQDWELILVDDGSKDGSLTLAKSLKDPRVRLYSDGETKGLPIRLNQMIEMAQSPYFFRMDADDIMHPHRAEKQYNELVKHDNNTVIGTAAYSIDSNSCVIGLRSFQAKQQVDFQARHSFIHPTVAASIEWFRQNQYSEQLVYRRAEDAELWCRTTVKTKFINLKEPLLYYREVKCFNLKNYLSTSLGILCILVDYYSIPTNKFLYLLFREIFKILVATLMEVLGKSDWLVARRYKALSLKDIQQANTALELVKQQCLPTI